jgi:small GTP-binding protein
MQMAAKIVYYGPGLCGKTTNLQYIYRKTSPSSRGEIVSLETETDRTLFFDLLPIDVGTISGFKTRFQLYTVPGQVFYNSTRKLVLRSVDGIVFVADSQVPMLDANIESLNNLKDNLAEYNVSIDEIPLVFQYNKRDLKNILSVEELNKALNPKNYPYYEAAAIYGKGVFETLKGISKLTLIAIRKKALQQPSKKTTITLTTPTSIQSPKTTTVSAYLDQAISQGKDSPSPHTFITKQELEKEKVEFAEVTNEKAEKSPVSVKKISLKSMEEIEKQLKSLREESTKTTLPVGTSPQKSFSEVIDSLLAPPKEEEEIINKKLRIRLDENDFNKINKMAIDLALLGENIRKNFSNALSIALANLSQNPKKIKLTLDIEILKKE